MNEVTISKGKTYSVSFSIPAMFTYDVEIRARNIQDLKNQIEQFQTTPEWDKAFTDADNFEISGDADDNEINVWDEEGEEVDLDENKNLNEIGISQGKNYRVVFDAPAAFQYEKVFSAKNGDDLSNQLDEFFNSDEWQEEATNGENYELHDGPDTTVYDDSTGKRADIFNNENKNLDEITLSKNKRYRVEITDYPVFNYTTYIDASSLDELSRKLTEFYSSKEYDQATDDTSNYSWNEPPEEEIYDDSTDQQIDLDGDLNEQGMFVNPKDHPKFSGVGTKLKDVMQKHNISLEDLKNKIKQGAQVEKEHTTNLMLAVQIALDHLYEDINYYDKLSGAGLEENTLDGQIMKMIKQGIGVDEPTDPPTPQIKPKFNINLKRSSPKKKKRVYSIKEITLKKNQHELIQKVKKYFDRNYSFYSHSLNDSQIEDLITKEINHPSCPKDEQAAIRWAADSVNDFILSNGLADDIQL